ncbi:MAG: hypothetical protein WC655_01775 [Candidatus Hydrogenedentales bacterium]|jgi:hypothetical protein
MPDVSYVLELCRPWKLCTYFVGIGVLACCSEILRFSDWDIGISLLMGTLTYVCAPWSVKTMVNAARRRTTGWVLRVLAGFALAWVVTDLSYWAYNAAMGHQMFRWLNFKISFPLYFVLGIMWSYQGSLRDMSKRTSL